MRVLEIVTPFPEFLPGKVSSGNRLEANDVRLDEFELLLLLCRLTLCEFRTEEGLQATNRAGDLDLGKGFLHRAVGLLHQSGTRNGLERSHRWRRLLDVENEVLLLASRENTASGGLYRDNAIGRAVDFFFLCSSTSSNEGAAKMALKRGEGGKVSRHHLLLLRTRLSEQTTAQNSLNGGDRVRNLRLKKRLLMLLPGAPRYAASARRLEASDAPNGLVQGGLYD